VDENGRAGNDACSVAYLGAARRDEVVPTRTGVSLTAALVTALDRLDAAALLVDRRMKVALANNAAERLLGDGLSIVRGYLRASHGKQQHALERFVTGVLQMPAESEDLGPIALRRASGRPPLLLQAVPVRSAPHERKGPAALILVLDPAQHPAHDPEKALRLLGLTPSEARLAVLLGTGHPRARAAEMLGISPHTAADTTKQIYSKLGITRQSSLVRLVTRLATLERTR
jgi:DNA-binding CsgD family transcriptional regulator